MSIEQFRFLRWKIYEDSQELFSKILILVKTLPKEHRFDLGDQMTRSSLSIILNIAEGSGKATKPDLNRFLDIALGSSYETLACIDTLHRNNFLTTKERDEFFLRIQSISSQIGGFKKSIRS